LPRRFYFGLESLPVAGLSAVVARMVALVVLTDLFWKRINVCRTAWRWLLKMLCFEKHYRF